MNIDFSAFILLLTYNSIYFIKRLKKRIALYDIS